MPEGAEDQPRRRGRPPGKRGTFSFRVTATLREKLEAAAALSGRPVSEEIEQRLEQSFSVQELNTAISSLLGGDRSAAIINNTAEVLRMLKPPLIADTLGLHRRIFLSAIQVIAEHHLPDQVPLGPSAPEGREWDAACERADAFGARVAENVMSATLERAIENVLAAREPDDSLDQTNRGFVGGLMSGPAGRSVPEEKQIGSQVVAETAIAPRKKGKTGDKKL